MEWEGLPIIQQSRCDQTHSMVPGGPGVLLTANDWLSRKMYSYAHTNLL